MQYPDIDIVIIGINAEKYLDDCLQSILASDYPQEKLHIIYSDGGSSDQSIAIAQKYPNVKTIVLQGSSPTPGKGRNQGYLLGSSPYVHFLDCDTTLEKGWLKKAVSYMENSIAAVCGYRQEKYPEKNIFHRIIHVEWSYEPGLCRYFGGDVLVRRKILEEVGGFDANLIAGEDPDLSYRIRQKGYRILRSKDTMTFHDINMRKFSQYYKRAYRTGYGYAELGMRFRNEQEKLWWKELLRVTLIAGASWTALFVSVILYYLQISWQVCIFILLGGLFLAFRNLIKIYKIQKKWNIDLLFSIYYALHLGISLHIQFFGVLRFTWGKLFRNPLSNRRLK
ncbi:MAG: glycosyltransferase [Spirochaetota bacterium]